LNLGAEPKKMALLGVLLLGALIALYVNVFSSSDSPAPAAGRVPVPAAQTVAPPGSGPRKRRETEKSSIAEFKPRQGVARPEDRPEATSIDPTLRLDLLAKVQNVEPEPSIRNLFQYGAAAPPPSATKLVELPKGVAKIPINQPPPPPAAPTGPPPAPTAPPMTFKYYGYKVAKATGRKQAFLLDGDEIIIAGENDAVKNARYKIVKIGVNSITIEDTQFKSQQTLQLQEDAVG
jgi:hypothetical protein